MDLDEIRVEPSSNLRHEKTLSGASSVPQDESRGLNEMSPEDLYSLKRQVYEYARKDMWKEAEPIFNKYADMLRIPLMYDEDTALRVAVRANSISFVKGLVNLMTPQDLQILNSDGYTALHKAAEAGNRDIIQIMIEKNQNLPLIITSELYTITGRLPVHYAAYHGHHKIVQDLSSKTLLQKMDSKDIETLFFWTVVRDMLDVATKLFERNDWEPDFIALERLLQKASEEFSTKEGNNNNNRGASSGDGDCLQLLQKVWHQVTTQLDWTDILKRKPSSLEKAMTDALDSGNVEALKFLKFLISKSPKVLELQVNSNEENILHYAVRQHPKSSFVPYLFQMARLCNNVLEAVDIYDNNILHFAAHPLEIEENSSSMRATTKMTRQVAWFKEIEKKTPSRLRTMRNKEGKTPKDVFLDKHKDLSREVKDTAKGIAESGMLVAALVATVAFAAALTVPGDKTSTWFIVFILANAAALFTSSASILSFLSNFTTSRFADSEFVIALHPSLILGPLLLLISIVTVVISFAAASFLIFEHTSRWAAYVVVSMGVFPILLFLLFQFQFFDEYLWSRFYRMP